MSDQPNIVIVLLDQLRYDVVADPHLCSTPNLDRTRAQGAWFEQHHTPAGICSPARGSLMTGLYPHGHGVLNNVHGRMAMVKDLSDEHPTLGELLSDAGYRTGYIGKWHLGKTRGAVDRGWADVRFPEGEDDPSLATGLRDYLHSMVYTRPGHEAGPQFAMYLQEPVPAALVPANIALEEALGLLDRYAGGRSPFCLVVSFPEPHHPTILTDAYIDRYDPASITPWPSFADTFEGKPGTNESNLQHYGVVDFTWDDWAPVVAHYLASVTMLDDILGQLLAELERLEGSEDTVVVITADHGDMLGSHRQFNKGPMMYDDVYRIPLCIRAPEALGGRAGRRVPSFTSHVDLLPTLAELAGVALPVRSWPGRSLVPWLTGADLAGGADGPDWRESLMCEFHGDEFGYYSLRMLRRGDHKLVYNPNDVNELYDLAADPHELCNLAGDPGAADLRVHLERELLHTMRTNGDPLAEFAAVMLG